MEQPTYNQQQYQRALRRKVKCKKCHQRIVWMKTVDGKNIAVSPLKVYSTEPGERILDEDGMILVNCAPKVGWTIHICRTPSHGNAIAPQLHTHPGAIQTAV